MVNVTVDISPGGVRVGTGVGVRVAMGASDVGVVAIGGSSANRVDVGTSAESVALATAVCCFLLAGSD
jgi:hypothetical protein